MKRIITTMLFVMCFVVCFSQEVEKLGETIQLPLRSYPSGGGTFPSGIYVDEKNYDMLVQDPMPDELLTISLLNVDYVIPIIQKRTVPRFEVFVKLGSDYWGISGSAIHPIIENVSKPIIRNKNGISFILKKGDGYIVYYVDEKGIPGAVDTTGKIYTNIEAISYLEEYDAVKYEASKKRAIELGLGSSFEKKEVLVWGETYYSTERILVKFWKPERYLYPNMSQPIQYDLQGNGYMASFYPSQDLSEIDIVTPNGKWLVSPIKLQSCSTIINTSEYHGNYSASCYVGFGGNIYYYIAGTEYTEVFRIRRTWGKPDNYALAINGYTADTYGTYVTETLETMTKAELRLLRNTIFALYGYHFNSADLKDHFEKQVWYIDEGKTTSDIELPEHRQKLLELIQEEERKR